MIFLDVDGVIANFVRASFFVHIKEPEEPSQWNYFETWNPPLTSKEFWLPIHAIGDRFYDEWVGPYPWTHDLVAEVQKHDKVCLLTDSSSHPTCIPSKIRWCERYAPGLEVIIAKSKELLAGPGRLLIDDNDSNCDKFFYAGGNVIRFPQPWNSRAVMTVNRMGYIKQMLEIWSKQNERVYN